MTSLPQAQRVARLTPVQDVYDRLAACVSPVPPRTVALENALGRILAADTAVASPLPQAATALHDGWAVAASAVSDASSYAPALLAGLPLRVENGDALPPRTDAVLARDAVVVRGATAEALAAVAPGEGVLAPGTDADPVVPLRRAGERLRATDIAVAMAAGVETVSVREARVLIVSVTLPPDRLDTVAPLVAHAVTAAGGSARITQARGIEGLEQALSDLSADAVMAIGGTGEGVRDRSVQTLARIGRVEAHGIALRPGETAAFGMVGMRSVLLLPGRFDAALAVWLTVGAKLLARMSGATEVGRPRTARLARKISSTLGVTELVPVATSTERVVPLASGYLPWQALTRAEAYVLVPPESEGYPAGSIVELWPFP